MVVSTRRLYAAMCMAVGYVSFDDCDLLTSSLGWMKVFPSPSLWPCSTWARLETTSLTFMLDCVPDPVCQMTNGNWSANWPASISSHTWAMRSRFSAGSIPASALVYAAAFLRYANASMISLGIEAEGPILKLLRERSVCAPQ